VPEDDLECVDFEDAPTEIKASVVVFDNEITPTQLRNLESATDAEVLDRAGVIVEIFSRHAQTREAKLQVEIAKLNYLAPRLRMSNVGGDRQGGGIGAKGAGETAHELDRRRIRDRIRRSEEHTSELQSRENLVCRLLLEKKKKNKMTTDRSKNNAKRSTGIWRAKA